MDHKVSDYFLHFVLFSQQIPIWLFNGVEYPYYEVEMTGGTPCDLLDNMARTTRVLYICDEGANPVGSVRGREEGSSVVIHA